MKWVCAAVCAVFLAAAAPAHAVVFNAPRGVSSFKVPRGVTQIKVTAVGERGGGQGGFGREVVHTIMVTAGDVLTLKVGTGGGAPNGGGLSGVFAPAGVGLPQTGRTSPPGESSQRREASGRAVAEPLVVAGGGGGAGSAAAGSPAGTGTTLNQSDGGAGTSGGGGGGAGSAGGAGGIDGSGGAGGSSLPIAGVTASSITPSLTLEYDDADAPLITLSAPEPLNPTFVAGVAGTEGGDGGSVSVRLFNGDQPTGEPVAASNVGIAPDGAFSAALASLSDGTWTVQAVQFDIAGHEGASNAVTFVVDQTGPQLQITWPGPVTNDPQTAIEGIAGSERGDRDEVTVTVTGPNGFSETIAATVRGETFSAAPSVQLPDGTYRVVATQADEHQHVGTATSTFVVDTVAPVITLGGAAGDVASVSLSGTASEGESVAIEFTGGRRIAVPIVNGAFAATLTLPDGAYTAVARLFDDAGNVAEATRTFRLDTTEPVVDFAGLHATYTRGETVSGAFTCVDPAGVAACDGAVDTATAGAHVLTVTTRDRLGNAGTASARYTVVAPPVATVRKTASALKITKATRRGRTLTVKGTALGTGTVTVSAGGVKKRVKLSRGAWSATLKLRRAKKTTVTATYGGDAGYLAATVRKSVK